MISKIELNRILKQLQGVDIAFVDLFCGAGGVTSGIHKAKNEDGHLIAHVITCVNHDPLAIESHFYNHPTTKHYTEDIRTLDITELVWLVKKIREKYPNIIIALWASLECTNFSKAKGGLSRDADSRTLAEHLFRYIDGIDPDYIWIENVEEFMSWGPLNRYGKPISKDKGKHYIRWVKAIKQLGYNFEHSILNAANYGAYTSRKRYFGQFAKPGFPIAWPVITHTKNGPDDFNRNIKKWKAVKDVLNFEDTGRSIFTRKKPLSDKTYERVYHGLIKFVAGGKEQHNNFIVKYMSLKTNGSAQNCSVSTENICPTVTTHVRMGLASVKFLLNYHHSSMSDSVDKPVGALTTKDKRALITPFIMRDFTNGGNLADINSPAGAVMPYPKMNLVTPFIMRDFTSEPHVNSIDNPAGSLTVNPKMNLVSPKWLMDTQYKNKGASIDKPAPTITANRKHFYLMTPDWIKSNSIDINNKDEFPPFISDIGDGQIGIEVYEYDSKYTVLVKEFMAMYGIVDIKMRMLRVIELLRIQGFDQGYYLAGTQADQKKFIGNAVEVTQAQKLIEASYHSIIQNRKSQAA